MAHACMLARYLREEDGYDVYRIEIPDEGALLLTDPSLAKLHHPSAGSIEDHGEIVQAIWRVENRMLAHLEADTAELLEAMGGGMRLRRTGDLFFGSPVYIAEILVLAQPGLEI